MSHSRVEGLSTGVTGVDDILHDGFIPKRSYKLVGEPGTGKSILGLHFLIADTEQGETTLYINLDEIEALDLSLQEFAHELQTDVEWDGTQFVMIDGINGYELSIRGDNAEQRRKLHTLCRSLETLRHIEMDGELRKVIGILKNRTSGFERPLREFQITAHGITIGESLTYLRGILQETPEWSDGESE